jgi:ACT domain-containing protein
MRAVIHVTGKDQVGIIANVTGKLAQHAVNILDITQTILPPDLFTMVMLVETAASPLPFGELADTMAALGDELGLSIRAQREDTFHAMHRI